MDLDLQLNPSAATRPWINGVAHTVMGGSSFVVLDDSRIMFCWVEIIGSDYVLRLGYVDDEGTLLTVDNCVGGFRDLITHTHFTQSVIQRIGDQLVMMVFWTAQTGTEANWDTHTFDADIENPVDTIYSGEPDPDFLARMGHYCYVSDDEGETWTIKGELPLALYDNTYGYWNRTWGGSNADVEILATETETGFRWSTVSLGFANVFGDNGAEPCGFYSDDEGVTWAASTGSFHGNAAYGGEVGRQMSTYQDGKTYMTSFAFGRNALMVSPDFGATWSAYETEEGTVGAFQSLGWGPWITTRNKSKHHVLDNTGRVWQAVGTNPMAQGNGVVGLTITEDWVQYRHYPDNVGQKIICRTPTRAYFVDRTMTYMIADSFLSDFTQPPAIIIKDILEENDIDTILASNTKVYSKVDIYEEDGSTLWLADAPFLQGDVTVDASRDDRRSGTFLFFNEDNQMDHAPGHFWYDKIMKPYRGIQVGANIHYWQVGEFLVDDIGSQDFPKTVSVQGRDYASKLMADEFATVTTFAVGQAPESIVKAIAYNGGISLLKMVLAPTGKSTGKDFTFEAGKNRMAAIHDVATAYGCEVFFDAQGFMVMREYQDPATSPVEFTFQTGARGSISRIKKRSGKTRIYNHIVVTGGDATSVPVFAEAENNDPSSPTRISEIGRRTYRFTSSFLTTVQQCQDVADKFLKIHALEEYNVDLETLVIPSLEASNIIKFIDPDPDPDQPDTFLLHNFTLPLRLGRMKINGRRVTSVG